MKKMLTLIATIVAAFIIGAAAFDIDDALFGAQNDAQGTEAQGEDAQAQGFTSSWNAEKVKTNSANPNVRKDYQWPAELLPAKPAEWKSKVKDLIRHKAYTLLYNTEYNTPTWVAWKLTKAHTKGNITRSQKFFADPSIPRQYRVDFFDYRREWDRGHMCPAGDNKWDEKAMYECFYMSNMCPQDHELNSGAWGKLEIACRYWAQAEGAVYIVCGPVYKGTRHRTIGQVHKVQVPEGFFKAVVSLKKGHEKAIGFYFDNNDSKQNYRKQFMSVDDLEKKINLNLFANLTDDIENRIEAKADINAWRYVKDTD